MATGGDGKTAAGRREGGARQARGEGMRRRWGRGEGGTGAREGGKKGGAGDGEAERELRRAAAPDIDGKG
ncbi:UNVERIFIED_CONTAM: hypothetical protein Sradi_1519200 [Sesamum radiatum]|uniref:Uncharacterized protein n=1 Tax=Sesamum radiatum TaxID=300843 RepID=A0AAW2U9Y4_SESRA